MSYTPEEEFYGRVAYEAAKLCAAWHVLAPSLRGAYIDVALAARAAVYVDPVQEVANKLFEAVHGTGVACTYVGGDYLKMARAAIAMGAKP